MQNKKLDHAGFLKALSSAITTYGKSTKGCANAVQAAQQAGLPVSLEDDTSTVCDITVAVVLGWHEEGNTGLVINAIQAAWMTYNTPAQTLAFQD
jgi:hypothetical protein